MAFFKIFSGALSRNKRNLTKYNAEQALIKERLFDAARSDSAALLKHFNNTLDGYTEEEAEEQRERFGGNEITQQNQDSLLKRIVESYVNPFTVVLFVLAAISLFTDVLLVAPQDRDPTSVIIVMAMVIISGTLRFVQESRSNKSAEKLKAMVKTTIAVERQPAGRAEIPLADVVVGDIIHIAAGDMIPADLRVLHSKDLFVSQASLTGESEPLEKVGAAVPDVGNNPLEINNLAFMGSNVVSGSALCVTIAVGDDTFFGSMAQSITGKRAVTSFEKGVNSVSVLLIRFMMVMVPFVFFINGFTKGDWLEAFLFALSIAVGLTPEMLPMIVTTGLARGAVNMSRKKTVVKNLSSIQNFGAMDILCTDKTGTITQDRVVLEYHLNIHGETDERVLRHAFLNSFHQTGLKNLMDIAILKYADDNDIRPLSTKYHKVDEIPFDFNRRRMSVVVEDEQGKTQMITKGAVEEMLAVCSFAEYKGKVEPLTRALCDEVTTTVQRLNDEGMRVIAVAQRTNPPVAGVFSVADEADMVLMGYLAFLDPPKESSKLAIQALKEYGVGVKVLTGDNDAVTRCVCGQVGLNVDNLLLGSQIDEMTDEDLYNAVETTNVFAKLSPQQKVRIVSILRSGGHVVGFMGDGINDAAAMKEADVGVSVDTAVDIAKESADIILLEKDLMVLERGVIEGRRTFGNIIKYVKMTASSNFGNMFSVLAASIFLPFLPMIPVQILVLNLIYDTSCISIPWDNVDDDYLRKSRKWDAASIGRFMLWIGPTSSVFDITTYILMYFLVCPAVLGGAYGAAGVSPAAFMALFNAGWFVESLWSQTLVIHMIRTPRIPFLQSRASKWVLIATTVAIVFGTVIPFTPLGAGLGMLALPPLYFPYLILMIFAYMALATLVKIMFARRYGELL